MFPARRGEPTIGGQVRGESEERNVALEMRDRCERCGTAALPPDAPALICSYECTFCVPCGDAMSHVCPNCGGELVARPRRVVAS